MGMGISGAALATVIAQTISAVLCGAYTLRGYGDYMPRREHFAVPRETIFHLLSTGVAMVLMVTVVDVGSLVYQRANNAFGEIIITAHMASRRIISICLQPMNSIAAALATFVGQNYGAGKMDRIRTAIRKICVFEVAFSIASLAALFFIGASLVRLITGTSDAEIVKNAVMSIRIHATFFPFVSLIFCLRSAMQSMDLRRPPILSSCIELVLKFFAAAWFIPALGFLGTSLTEPLIWVVMSTYLIITYMAHGKRMLES